MKIGIATMEKIENRLENSVGSSRIRGRWLAKYWSRVEGYEVEEYQVGRKYDVMIFQKAYWHEMMEEFKGIKIFDLCDPDWLDPRPVIESMELCDAMVTSTEPLAEYLRKFIKDKLVLCIPDRVDLEEHEPRGVHEGVAKKIVWFGYGQNNHYLINTFDFLIDKGLELTTISNVPCQIPMGFDKLKVNFIEYNYRSIHEELKRFDFVLLPQTGSDLRGKYKSNNKVLTSWALGLPVAQLPEDLDRFMVDKNRNIERELRLKEIKERWDIRISVQEYIKVINDVITSKK